MKISYKTPFWCWIQIPFLKWKQDYRARQAQKRAIMLDNLSCEDINVMEFNGRLYISHNGVPIVRVEDLKVKAPELLVQAREDYLAWKSKFNK